MRTHLLTVAPVDCSNNTLVRRAGLEDEEIDARLMDAGSDVSKAQEIQIERDAKASKMQLYYDEWERLEGVLARAEEIRAAQEVPA